LLHFFGWQTAGGGSGGGSLGIVFGGAQNACPNAAGASKTISMIATNAKTR
jgi:hypothetical protein